MVIQKFWKNSKNKKFVEKDISECFGAIWRSSKKCKIEHYSQSFCFAPHKPAGNLNILKENIGILFL